MARRRLTGRAYHAGREQAVLLPFFRFTHPLPPHVFSPSSFLGLDFFSDIIPNLSDQPALSENRLFLLKYSISQLVVGSVILLIFRSFFHNIADDLLPNCQKSSLVYFLNAVKFNPRTDNFPVPTLQFSSMPDLFFFSSPPSVLQPHPG